MICEQCKKEGLKSKVSIFKKIYEVPNTDEYWDSEGIFHIKNQVRPKIYILKCSNLHEFKYPPEPYILGI